MEEIMSSYQTKASQNKIDQTINALKAKGYQAEFAPSGAAALAALKAAIPAGSEVFTMSSITLEQIGAAAAFNDAAVYAPVRDRLYAMNRETEGRAMAKLGASPDVAIGSAHALTESGSLLIASMTGSQLPAYAYGAGKVFFVLGAQKIVADFEAGMQRINNYVVGQESIRARKAYGLPDSFNSFVGKLLVINGEANPARIHVIIVGEVLGF